MIKNLRQKKLAFTLFEVLVALAILSITMVAGIVSTDNVLKRTVYIEKKLLAHWVGMNILNSMELKLLRNKLAPSDTTGKSTMRGHEFTWQLKIDQVNISNANLLNMQVLVSGESIDKNILDSVNRSITNNN